MPAGFYDSKGRLQKLSFTEAFLGAYVGQRGLRTVKQTAKIVDVPKPVSLPAVAPPTTTIPVLSPSSGVIQAETTIATVEEAKPAEVPLTWTELEDATLIGLKSLNKTWKEIGAIMTNKPTEDLRERYDELNVKTVKATEVEKKDDEPKAEATEKNGANADGQHGDKEKGKGKGKKDKEKGKHQNGAKKAAKATVETADSEDSQGEEAKEETVKAKSANITKGNPLKPILKKGKGSQEKVMEDDEPTHYQDRPVIFVDDGDALSVAELMNLYHIHQSLEKKKWVELSSKFFDRTGKRVSPELLKERLRNC